MAITIITGATTNGRIENMQNGAISTNVAVTRNVYNKESKMYQEATQWFTVVFAAGEMRERAEKLLTAGENAVKSVNIVGNLTATLLKYQDGSEHASLTIWADSISYAYAGGSGLCQVTLQGILGNAPKAISDKNIAMSIAETLGYGDNKKSQWHNVIATGDIRTQVERMKVQKKSCVDVTYELDSVSVYNGEITIKGQLKNVVYSAQRPKREEAPQSNASQPQNAIAQPAPMQQPAYAAPVQSAPVPQPTAYVAPAQPAPQYQAPVQPQQPVYTAPVQSVPVPQPAPVPQTPTEVASGFMPDDDALNALIASANGQFAM